VRFLVAPSKERAPRVPAAVLQGTGWVLWGQYAMILSGALLVHVVTDSPAMMFAAVVACLAHALIVGGSDRVLLPPAMSNILAACAFAWIIWEMRAPRQVLPHSVARFLVIVLMVKLYGRRDTGALRLSQFALLAVLLAVSREGVRLSFLWAFLLCLGSMGLSTMSLSLVPWASGARSQPDVPRARDVISGGWAPCLAVLICAAGLFVGFPRSESHRGTLGVGSGGQLVTGYTGEVSLRHVGKVRETSEETLRVRFVAGDVDEDLATSVVPPRFLLRGASLVRYKHGKWSAEPKLLRIAYSLNYLGNREIAHPYFLLKAENGVATQSIRQYIKPGLSGGRTPMALYLPTEVNGSARPIVPVSQKIRLSEQSIAAGYEVLSLVPTPTLERLKDAVAPERAMPWEIMWEVPPEIEPVLRDAIKQIKAEMKPTTDFERVQAVMKYLRDPNRFSYTLDLPPFGDGDPLAAFLQTTHRGSCQQFASAMVLILRAWGLPARLVAGYKCNNFDPETEWYVCRGRDAHAWVDVFFNEIGWLEFDPTPGYSTGASPGADSGSGRDKGWGWWRRMNDRWDAADSWVGRSWSRHVVRFSPTHQKHMHKFVSRNMIGTRDVCRGIVGRLWPKLQMSGAGAVAVVLGMSLAAVALIVFGVHTLSRWSHRDRSRASEGRRFYLTLMRILARHGLRRAPSTTPREFAAQIGMRLRAQTPDGALVADAVDTITDLYCRVRFGRHEMDTSDQSTVAESLHTVATAPRILWKAERGTRSVRMRSAERGTRN